MNRGELTVQLLIDQLLSSAATILVLLLLPLIWGLPQPEKSRVSSRESRAVLPGLCLLSY